MLTPQTEVNTAVCMGCKEPLRMLGVYLDAFRAQSGRLFCSEWCAESNNEVAPYLTRRS